MSKPRRFTISMFAVGMLVITLAAAVLARLVRQQHHAADYAEATSNMRSLSCALLEFNQEFGAYPCERTRQEVIDATNADLGPWTGSSNDCFRQLIAYGIQSEQIFFAVHPEGTHKPDSILQPFPTAALAAGEVGLNYVYGLDSSYDFHQTPILLAPMKSGTHLAHRTYDGKVAMCFLDGSSAPCTANRHGEILLPDGTRLLNPAKPYWNGKPIDIRHPDFPK